MKKLKQTWLAIKINTLWRFEYSFFIPGIKSNKKYFTYEKQLIHEKPLLYSCSGCSSAAQMANYIAIQLDRNGIAEMSCIVGVGGNVKKLVHTALSGRKIITIDGCPLACSRACLGNHSINADGQFELTAMGVEKRNHVDFNIVHADIILNQIQKKIMELDLCSN